MEHVRAAVVSALRRHPRVAQQGVAEEPNARAQLAGAVPRIVPFPGREVHEVAALLDWDHKLPSQSYKLRLHVFYTAAARDAFAEALAQRQEVITRRDLFPEFDVPDYDELPADERYEAEVDPQFAIEAMRFTSAWRREVRREIAEQAVAAVRASPEFAAARAATSERPQNLGDLETVAWMAPCESGHPIWTLDVWWLTAFDGRIGRGWSFLVDPAAKESPIVAQREFTVRTS